jgi:hypothetical protein
VEFGIDRFEYRVPMRLSPEMAQKVKTLFAVG